MKRCYQLTMISSAGLLQRLLVVQRPKSKVQRPHVGFGRWTLDLGLISDQRPAIAEQILCINVVVNRKLFLFPRSIPRVIGNRGQGLDACEPWEPFRPPRRCRCCDVLL